MTDTPDTLVTRLRHSAERLSARRTGQLSASANYGNAGRGHCDPCLEPAIAACTEAADEIDRLTAQSERVVEVLRQARIEFSGIESLPRHSREDDAEVIDAMQQKAWRALQKINALLTSLDGKDN